LLQNGHAIYKSLPRHVVVGGNNRHQTYFSSLEEQVTADNPVRLMDAFVEKLELEKLVFTPTGQSAVFLKLYLYKDLRGTYYPIVLFVYGITVYSVVVGKGGSCKNDPYPERKDTFSILKSDIAHYLPKIHRAGTPYYISRYRRFRSTSLSLFVLRTQRKLSY
jgi:hypothetical protein